MKTTTIVKLRAFHLQDDFKSVKALETSTMTVPWHEEKTLSFTHCVYACICVQVFYSTNNDSSTSLNFLPFKGHPVNFRM